MTRPASKSVERSGFAALAALTLAPLFFHSGWPWLHSLPGVEGDAFSLTLASLFVAGAAVVAHIVFNQRLLFSSLLAASLTGIGAAVLLGKNSQSTLALALALIGVAVFASLLITWLVAHLPSDVDGLAKQHKVRTALFLLLALYTVGQTARISTFMGDAQRAEQSVLPDVLFFVNHSCLTAYAQALKLAQAGEENLYDLLHWPDELEQSEGRDNEAAQTGPYAPFYTDTFMYPPQFLLLPGAILAFSDDFLVQRALWFGFSGLWLAVGFWIAALWVGEKGNRRALWLIPLLWSSSIVLMTLQVGNVHHVVIVMAVLAMIAFERKRPALGGALLAFAILSKISPLFFGLILLAQRRWRDTAWTFAFGVGFTLLSALVFGVQPLQSFLLYQMPRLLSGEAMDWSTSSPLNVIINAAPFAIPLKLSALGAQFDSVLGAARLTNSLYTILLLGLTVFFSLQKRERSQKLYLWLAIFTLSSLQSPFAPAYVIMPVFWILALLATESKNLAGVVAVGAVWLLLSIPLPATVSWAMTASLFQQILVFGVLIFALLRQPAQPSPVPQLLPQPALA